jgi:hypothetical protein
MKETAQTCLPSRKRGGGGLINCNKTMKTTRLIPFSILLAALLPGMGCKTHTPMIRYHEGAYQDKLEAAAHWSQMANDLSRQLAIQPGLRDSAIFIGCPKQGASNFDVAYCRMLKAQLITQGWKVVDRPEAAVLQVCLESQMVAHGGRGYWDSSLSPFGTYDYYVLNPTTPWAMLGYTVEHLFTGDDTGLPFQTSTDLIVTTFVKKEGVLVFGHTQIVYVAANDSSLYMAGGNGSGRDWW